MASGELDARNTERSPPDPDEMVLVAEWFRHRIVDPDDVGSSPIEHPTQGQVSGRRPASPVGPVRVTLAHALKTVRRGQGPDRHNGNRGI